MSSIDLLEVSIRLYHKGLEKINGAWRHILNELEGP